MASLDLATSTSGGGAADVAADVADTTDVTDVADTTDVVAPIPNLIVPPTPPLIPYHAPPPLESGVKPLKPRAGVPTLTPAPGMNQPEYTALIHQTFVSNPRQPQEWELAQGYQRYNQLVYGVTY